MGAQFPAQFLAHFLVNVDVDDLERGVRFYTSVFGLEVGRRFGADGAELVGGPVPIYLLHKPAGSPATPAGAATRDYRRHWTPVHLDFVCDDVDAAVERALAAGATLERAARSHAWGRIALLADPFGHGVCVLQFLNRGYDEIAQ
jgi:predicted enzyme related to lactoylglutathione lyase